MPVMLRPYRRFPVQCAVTYNAGPFQEQSPVLACERMSSNIPDPQGVPLSVGCIYGYHLSVYKY